MLPDIKAALLALAASLTGLQAVWENQQRPYVDASTRAIVLCSFGPVQQVGVQDEIRSDWDASRDHEEWQDTVVGQRQIPWRVKVQSFEQTDTATAWDYLEAFRLRLRRQSTVDALNAVSCGIATTGQTLDLQVPQDDRIVSMAALDIGLNATFSEVDPNGYTYIATVTGTATIGQDSQDYTETIG